MKVNNCCIFSGCFKHNSAAGLFVIYLKLASFFSLFFWGFFAPHPELFLVYLNLTCYPSDAMRALSMSQHVQIDRFCPIVKLTKHLWCRKQRIDDQNDLNGQLIIIIIFLFFNFVILSVKLHFSVSCSPKDLNLWGNQSNQYLKNKKNKHETSDQSAFITEPSSITLPVTSASHAVVM